VVFSILIIDQTNNHNVQKKLRHSSTIINVILITKSRFAICDKPKKGVYAVKR